jgi:hypothetical protein
MTQMDPSSPEEPDLRSVVATARQVADVVRQLRTELREAAEKAEADVAREEADRKAAVLAEGVERRRKQRRLWVTIGLDVVLSLVSVSLFLEQRDTNHRLQDSLNQNYVTAQQQLETRQELLCPLYGTLYALAEAQPAGAPLTAAQATARDSAVETLMSGYAKAGCQPKLP